MAALIIRNLTPIQSEPGHTAQQIVMWYAERMWTLWVLLLALPFTALVAGCTILKQNWKRQMNVRQFAGQSLATGITTIAAGGILAVVIIHMLAD